MDGTRYFIVIDGPKGRQYVGARTWFTRRLVKRVNSAKVYASAEAAEHSAKALVDSDTAGGHKPFEYVIMRNQDAVRDEWEARREGR